MQDGWVKELNLGQVKEAFINFQKDRWMGLSLSEDICTVIKTIKVLEMRREKLKWKKKHEGNTYTAQGCEKYQLSFRLPVIGGDRNWFERSAWYISWMLMNSWIWDWQWCLIIVIKLRWTVLWKQMYRLYFYTSHTLEDIDDNYLASNGCYFSQIFNQWDITHWLNLSGILNNLAYE